jgi:hypothetical protein
MNNDNLEDFCDSQNDSDPEDQDEDEAASSGTGHQNNQSGRNQPSGRGGSQFIKGPWT